MAINNFDNGLKELGISLSGYQMDRFLLYYKMLIEWNGKMNLTAITKWEDVVSKHFLDSLCLVKAVPDPRGLSMIDVGTGAGFPGIPLKIAFPELDVLLVDSVGKKLAFITAVIEELGLKGVKTLHGRAEELGRDLEYRESFDLAVSRAVAGLAVLSEYCLPFVKVGGTFAAYKGAADAECESAKRAVFLLGGGTEKVFKYSLPGSGNRRSLICIEKIKETPRTYPRKAGTPSKNPL